MTLLSMLSACSQLHDDLAASGELHGDEPRSIRSFDDWAEETGFEPSEEQQRLLDDGVALVGVVPEAAMPVKHPNGALEVDEWTFAELETLDYAEDFASWYALGLYDPTMPDQRRLAAELGVDGLVDPDDPAMATPKYEEYTEEAAEEAAEAAEEAADADMCNYEMTLVLVADSDTDDDTNPYVNTGGCSDFDAEFTSAGGKGAGVYVEVSGGNPSSSTFASGTCTASATRLNGYESQMSAKLAKVGTTGGACPASLPTSWTFEAETDLHASNDGTAYAGNEAWVTDHASVSWASAYSNTAYVEVTVGGSDLSTQTGAADVEQSDACSITTSVTGSVGDQNGASGGISKTCSADTNFGETLTRAASAYGSATKTLKYNSTGANDTDLWASTKASAKATSAVCANGSGWFSCMGLWSTSGTDAAWSLSAEADGFCQVTGTSVPSNVSCSIKKIEVERSNM